MTLTLTPPLPTVPTILPNRTAADKTARAILALLAPVTKSKQ